MPPRKRAGASARNLARAKRVPLRKTTPSRRPALPPHVDRRSGQTGRPPKYFTPEFLAEAQRRVEQTSQSTTAIAGNFGMHHSVLARLIAREGWVRPDSSGRRRGLSGVMRLAAAADGLVSARAQTAPHPNPLPSERAFTPVFDGLGERERTAPAALPSHDNAGAPGTASIARLEAAVLKELGVVERMRASLGAEPLRPMDAERTARTLSVLTETLAKLRRLRLGAPQSGPDHDDDIPDIDEFRRDLARRIGLFVASRAGGRSPDDDRDVAVETPRA